MSKLVDYLVRREHTGDRITDDGTKPHHFQEGDTRRAHPGVVSQLVKSGILEAPHGEHEEKAEDEPAPENKAEGNAPENKAEKPPATKAPAK